ncbi:MULTISPECIES: hypothetical protein [Sphingomonas]|jgi:hypothetical protein|uniref:hypothetical protein n=1 Tax=Sphingomonas TaxID=13687 RepID=UPI00193C47B3|nr:MULTISPECIES: hypothetical protein [Sphingomonas]
MSKTMQKLVKSDFFWRFVGGFAIGAVGVVTLQPASAQHQSQPAPAAAVHPVR